MPAARQEQGANPSTACSLLVVKRRTHPDTLGMDRENNGVEPRPGPQRGDRNVAIPIVWPASL